MVDELAEALWDYCESCLRQQSTGNRAYFLRGEKIDPDTLEEALDQLPEELQDIFNS